MGSPEDEMGRSPNETRNRVRITQPFWIKNLRLPRKNGTLLCRKIKKKGSPIFHLTKKILEALCGSSGYQSGNFTISEFQDRDGEAIYLEEAINRKIWDFGREEKAKKLQSKFSEI